MGRLPKNHGDADGLRKEFWGLLLHHFLNPHLPLPEGTKIIATGKTVDRHDLNDLANHDHCFVYVAPPSKTSRRYVTQKLGRIDPDPSTQVEEELAELHKHCKEGLCQCPPVWLHRVERKDCELGVIYGLQVGNLAVRRLFRVPSPPALPSPPSPAVMQAPEQPHSASNLYNLLSDSAVFQELENSAEPEQGVKRWKQSEVPQSEKFASFDWILNASDEEMRLVLPWWRSSDNSNEGDDDNNEGGDHSNGA